MKKKILILAMSCNQQHFRLQEKNIKQLYAKDILEKKYENIDFWIYTASDDNKYHVNKNTHKLYIPCDDTLEGTYEKTYKCFNLINKLNFEYDYILRTNLSTYINIELLNRFVNELELDDIKVYAHKIYCTKNSTGPKEWCLYGVGNGLLLSKHYINILANNHISKYKYLDTIVKTDDKEYYKIDDNTIGYIINSYGLLNNMNIDNIWHSFNIDLIYKNICIPFRDYINDDRHMEFIQSKHIHEYIKNNLNNINKFNLNEIISDETIDMINFKQGINKQYKRDFFDNNKLELIKEFKQKENH